MITVRAKQYFHNGAMPDGIGLNWQPGEEREVTQAQFEQLAQDNPGNFLDLGNIITDTLPNGEVVHMKKA
jgi:hypothetical protein